MNTNALMLMLGIGAGVGCCLTVAALLLSPGLWRDISQGRRGLGYLALVAGASVLYLGGLQIKAMLPPTEGQYVFGRVQHINNLLQYIFWGYLGWVFVRHVWSEVFTD